MDFKKWEILQKLDPGFLVGVKRAYLLAIDPSAPSLCTDGYATYGGSLMVMKNGDVYFIALSSRMRDLLGHSPSGDPRPLTPKKIDALCGQEVRGVSCTTNMVTVLTAEGRICQWGLRIYQGMRRTMQPHFVSGNLERKKVVQVACSELHTLALTKRGEVYSWGRNDAGVLGIGSTDDKADPVRVPGLHGYDKRIVSIACGGCTSFALDNNGNVWSWGDKEGALGYAIARYQSFPKVVEGLSNIRKIAAGSRHTLALSSTEQMYFWGCHSCHACHATDAAVATPTKIEAKNVVDIGATRECSVSAFKTIEGNVYFWGFADGPLRPDPVLTEFSTMTELFASLNPPILLEPMEFPCSEPMMLEKCRQSFDDPDTGDVSFCVEGKHIYAHKLVLTIQSDYFRKMFQSDCKGQVEEKAVLEVQGFTYAGFHTFLKYLYTERIEPPLRKAADAIELFKLAHHYGEEDLKQRCEQQLEVLTTTNNVCKLYSVAVRCGSQRLLDLVMNTIVPNMNSVLKSEGYKKMRDELKIRLIQELADEDVFVGLKRKPKK